MKTKIIISTVIFCLVYILSNSQSLGWAKQIGSTTGNDEGKSITVDAFGNIYTKGYFDNKVDFDPGVGVYNLTSNGPRDIFISKLNAAGNFVWAKQLTINNSNDLNLLLTTDATGSVYTTGNFSGTVDFDPGSGVFSLSSAGAGKDIFIQKLDSNGNFVWAKKIGANGVDLAASISVDALGNVYTTGQYTDVVDFDPGVGVFKLTAPTINPYLFICKINAVGNFVWAKSIETDGNTNYSSIKADALGNVYTVGEFKNAVDLDPGIGTYTVSAGVGPHTFVVKLNTSGNFVWAKHFESNSTTTAFSSRYIEMDTQGDLYVAGNFDGTITFDPGINIHTLSDLSAYNPGFVCKLNSAGNIKWVKKIDNVTIDRIVIDQNNNLYFSDFFYLNRSVLKVNAFGNVSWRLYFGYDLYINSMAVNNAGELFFTGRFSDKIDVDAGADTIYLSSNSYDDAFILKYNTLNPCANDECSNAQQLIPTTPQSLTLASFNLATQSIAPENCTGSTSLQANDVWFKFVADSTTNSIVVNHGQYDQPTIGVYNSCGGNLLACVDTPFTDDYTTLTYNNFVIGLTYFIRVYANSLPLLDYDFSICVTNKPINPSNDDCTGALPITIAANDSVCNPLKVNTDFATNSNQYSTCWNATKNDMDDDVWYKFTATSQNIGMAVSNLSGYTYSSWSKYISYALYSGAPDSLTQVDCGSNLPYATKGFKDLVIGQTYYLQVMFGETYYRGTFDLCLFQRPAIDECSTTSAMLIPNSTCNFVSGTLEKATKSPMYNTSSWNTCDYGNSSFNELRDVWYKFVASNTFNTITVNPSIGLDVILAVFDSCGGVPFICENNNPQGGLENNTHGNYSVGKTYYIRVREYTSNSTTSTFNICITQPTSGFSATATSTPIKCNGASDGVVNVTAVGGTQPYNYSWNTNPAQHTQVATGVPAGTYVCLITDANNSTALAAIILKQPSALQITSTVTSVNCNTTNSGSVLIATAGGTAGYSYKWNNGNTTANLQNVPTGIYSVTVQDANACQAVRSFSIQQGGNLTNTISVVQQISCYGSSDGIAQVVTTGGTLPLTYLWSKGNSSSIASQLSVGILTVTVTDAAGCVATTSVNIIQPQILGISTSVINNTQCSNILGSINTTITGGTAPYNYNWNTGAKVSKLMNLQSGVYSVTVHDNNGCSASKTDSVKTISPVNWLSLPFSEGFSATKFVPTGWKYTAPVTNNKWKRVSGVGGFGTSSSCAVITHYSNKAIDKQRDELETPYINITGANNSLAITFDVAYAQRGTKKDSLLIYVSSDCSNIWQKVYAKGGSSLKTAPATNLSFKPTSSQWRKETINLAAYSGAANIKVRIVSVGNKGNNIYVDNIKLTYIPTTVPVASFTATTYNICASGSFKPTNTSIGVPTGYTWFMPGATPSTSTAKHPTIKFTAPGTYNVTLIAKNAIGNSTPFTHQVIVGNCKTTDEEELNNAEETEEVIVAEEASLTSNLEALVYPNPTTGELTIYATATAQKIQVVNVLGTVVAELIPQTQLSTIDLSQQTNGIYFVKVQQSNTVQLIRVVKQ
ncbi:MAG: T9SS type A sorting domain-containing protein [Bacteroidetes bacterium]|nr:T9SS type A sorting domain-containing protein [Bacteroidota bacterium]